MKGKGKISIEFTHLDVPYHFTGYSLRLLQQKKQEIILLADKALLVEWKGKTVTLKDACDSFMGSNRRSTGLQEVKGGKAPAKWLTNFTREAWAFLMDHLQVLAWKEQGYAWVVQNPTGTVILYQNKPTNHKGSWICPPKDNTRVFRFNSLLDPRDASGAIMSIDDLLLASKGQ